jgi:hypothetical protein
VNIGTPVRLHGLPLVDTLLGREIIDYLDLSIPWTNETLLSFYTMQTKLADELAKPQIAPLPKGTGPHGVTQRKDRKALYEYIANATLANTPSPMIRADVERIFGVRLSPSHMSQLRKRTLVKGNNL